MCEWGSGSCVEASAFLPSSLWSVHLFISHTIRSDPALQRVRKRGLILQGGEAEEEVPLDFR